MLHQAVFNTSEICHEAGVHHAVMSPGSRNAPLIVSFARNEKIKKWIIPDERSAGFIALGIAQKTKEPVVLCCTSGTALLNYAPAVAEAYYREIPLIVLSADRPPELIDQRDGQTIRQFEALKNHVKFSEQLPVIETSEDAENYTSDLISVLRQATSLPAGPVHINIPFREPFYPDKEQSLTFNALDFQIDKSARAEIQFPENSYSKILIVIGQQPYEKVLSQELNRLVDRIPILQSPLNNLDIPGIRHPDVFIDDQQQLQPELLITSGLSVLSKRLRNFIRKNKPIEHWHFDPAGVEVDTFQTNPKIIKAPLVDFLNQYSFPPSSNDFVEKWKVLDKKAEKVLNSFTFEGFSEMAAFNHVLKSLPADIDLHLSNSMPVRFAEIFGVSKGINVNSNRGTSGIEGVTSTALGNSLVSDSLNVLLIGDMSFLYDRNAFFHNHSYSNLRIIIFNNSGGGIFRLIDGPSELPELEEYFETRHNRSARYICKEYSIDYSDCSNLDELSKALEEFYKESDYPKLLEVFTNPNINEKDYARMLKKIRHAT
ncbi:MAG: 2-succinyl-5-enolpyruvyl-6-hydroxy-3-cyclohexene-1-carboxylic-acid synthase [Cytophagales bacterium]|nr:2-succinyl-5-enolpyruvyl-6-hydroxy-3-cyclohexene-1-carboxylic-acid synthase [Cytophagales bacterium]